VSEQQYHEFGPCAYEAYVQAVGGVSVHGEKLWTWAEMVERKPEVAAAWQEAGAAVARLFVGRGV